MEQWDVIVIGAGVVGSAVARELARYRLNVAVLEKELDIACGNSSRNTGMLHAGFAYKPGSLKAECAVEDNKEFDRVAAELGVPFKRTGKLVVGFTDHDMENILKFKAIGEQNGVEKDPGTSGPAVDENYQTTVPGVFAAGNVLHAHDLVDFVSLEAEALADGAARFIRESALPACGLAVRGNELVGGLTPSRISGEGDVTVSARVRRPLRDCTVELVQGERVVKRRRMPKALPAEMVQIKLRAEDLNQTDDLEVRVSC